MVVLLISGLRDNLILRSGGVVKDLDLLEGNGVDRAGDARHLEDMEDRGLDSDEMDLKEGRRLIGDTGIVLQEIAQVKETLETGRVNAVDSREVKDNGTELGEVIVGDIRIETVGNLAEVADMDGHVVGPKFLGGLLDVATKASVLVGLVEDPSLEGLGVGEGGRLLNAEDEDAMGGRDGLDGVVEGCINEDIGAVLDLAEDMEIGAGNTEEKDDERETDSSGDTGLDRDKDSDPEGNLRREEVPKVDLIELDED